MSSVSLWHTAAAALLVASAGGVWAAPIPITGSDTAAGHQVPANGSSVAARNTFIAGLGSASYGVEAFEGFQTGDFVEKNTLNIAAGATLTASGWNRTVDQPDNGRFNSTKNGKNWWETRAPFTIDFAQDIWAFGFYATDMADFGGSLTLDLFHDGVLQQTLTVVDSASQADGSLLFYGFTDSTGLGYDSIRVNVTQRGDAADYIGFDDLVFAAVGDPPDPVDVPEPASLALAAVALAGAAVGRRRRKG